MAAPQPAPTPTGGDGTARRKQIGQFFTPPALVDHVVSMALADWPGGRTSEVLTVVDPACGDGRFLVAAAIALHERGHRCRLVGVDVDPGVADTAGAALAELRSAHPDLVVDVGLTVGDALRIRPELGRADLVIGNPPFLNQMATATTRGARSAFGGGPYADVAAEFLALAALLARPDGGRVAFVLPQSLLSTRDTAPIRASVAERATVTGCWWSTRRMFDAHVHTCALAFSVGTPAPVSVARWRGPSFTPVAPAPPPIGGTWAPLLVDDPTAHVDAECGPTVGDRVTFTVGFRDEYYALAEAVVDDPGRDDPGRDDPRPALVTSGLIDPGVCHWGTREVRFAKRRFEAPRIDLDRLPDRARRWADRLLVPKVLVANQTRGIEVVVDRTGRWLPGVPVIAGLLRPDSGTDLDEVATVLSSPAAQSWVRALAAGSGLSVSSVRLSPALLASVPWPSTAPS